MYNTIIHLSIPARCSIIEAYYTRFNIIFVCVHIMSYLGSTQKCVRRPDAVVK